MEEKIQTLNPNPGKKGVQINKQKYDQVRQSIEETLGEQPGITFTGLMAEVERKLAGKFDGNISWYVTSVKLDLEAHGAIERIPRATPQRLQLTTPHPQVEKTNGSPSD